MPGFYQHPNCKAYNWLVYRCLKRVMQPRLPAMRGTVVDLGCGETPYRELVLKWAERYIGVDWEKSLHAHEADIVADLNGKLPIGDETASTVLSLSVMEHLPRPDNLAAEAFRILEPGGQLFLQVPWQWGIHEAPYDYFRYTPYALEQMLRAAGFRRVAIEPMGGFMETMALKFNYFTVRLLKGPKLLRLLLAVLLFLPWQLSQLSALLLSGLDRHPAREAIGYWINAEK